MHALLRKHLFFPVLFTLLCLITIRSEAQKNSLTGIVRDTTEKIRLHYAIVALINRSDSTLYRSVRTNEAGIFLLKEIPPGNYTIMVSYPRMADYLQDISVQDTSKINLGNIDMITEAVLLQEVVVRANMAVRMRGDTLEYNADSFATKPGASVEDLLKRLPGMQLDNNGKITAQGQEVKKILVDGDEFFSDDPGLATKYLRADAIDKVQVFDKKSDQSEFTGIDDGSRTKTINLKLKKNKKNGSFGKLSAGSDFKQDYYNYDAMAAIFNNAMKASVFGLAARTGKSGLSNNELSKYISRDYEMIDDGTGSVYISSNGEYENENYYGNGIPEVLTGGAHYSNKWKDNKQKLFTNYRVKKLDADGWSYRNSTNILPDSSIFYNQSNSTENTYSFSQKASGNFTTPLDSFSTIKISLNGGMNDGQRITGSENSSRNGKNLLVNTGRQSNRRETDSKNFGGNITYQRKFRKEGRTLSVAVQQEYSNGSGDSYNFSANNFYDPATGSFMRADTLDQLQTSGSLQQSYATRMVYTEKLSNEFRMSAEYGWKTAMSNTSFNTFNATGGKYTDRIDSLSNDYDFRVRTNIAGATLSWNRKKINITAGGRVFFTGLKQENNDLHTINRRDFVNIAPQTNATYRFKQNSSLQLSYSGETFQPSVEQLQPLRRSSNPTFTQIGNPNLRPGYRHNANLNYNNYNWVKGRNIYGYVSFNYSDNNITTKTTTDAQNRTTSQFINLDGLPGMYSSLSYSWEYKKIHLRPSISANYNLSGNNSILNEKLVRNRNWNTRFNAGLNYEIKNVLTASYNGSISYTSARSNVGSARNRNTVSHNHNISATGYLPLKFELSSDCNMDFQLKNSSFNANFSIIRWNAALQKRFLKKDQLFARLSVNDILNNNTGYSRNISGNNFSESDRLVVKRYWLLTLGWNFSKALK